MVTDVHDVVYSSPPNLHMICMAITTSPVPFTSFFKTKEIFRAGDNLDTPPSNRYET